MIETKEEKNVFDQIIDMGNYGFKKMEIFKSKAREILGRSNDQSQYVENLEYNPNQIHDVVTAYKSLKQVMQKSSGLLSNKMDLPLNAGYLKRTIATQQQSRVNRMNPDLLKYSLAIPSKFEILTNTSL